MKVLLMTHAVRITSLLLFLAVSMISWGQSTIINPIDDIVVPTNAAPVTINLSQHIANDDGSTLYPILVPQNDIITTNLLSDGTLTITFLPNKTGAVVITAQDFNRTVSTSFTVHVVEPTDAIGDAFGVIIVEENVPAFSPDFSIALQAAGLVFNSNNPLAGISFTSSDPTKLLITNNGTSPTLDFQPGQFGHVTLTVGAVDSSGTALISNINVYINSAVIHNPSNNAYYQAIFTPLEWESALANAQSMRFTPQGEFPLYGDLVSINSQEEQGFIQSQFLSTGSKLWIGASRNAQGDFQWTRNEWFNYTNWNDGEPNNFGGTENAAEMQDNGKWNDIPSTGHPRGYIVEYQPKRVFNASNGYFYSAIRDDLTWLEAKSSSENRIIFDENGVQYRSRLVTISSQEEQDFVFNQIADELNTELWIGLSRTFRVDLNDFLIGIFSPWKWTSNKNLEYSNWDVNEPRDSLVNHGDFVLANRFSSISANGKWKAKLGPESKFGEIDNLPTILPGYIVEYFPITVVTLLDIDDVTLPPGKVHTIDLRNHFSDNGLLTYTIDNTLSDHVTAEINGDQLKLFKTNLDEISGSSQIAITASDQDGNNTSAFFTLTIKKLSDSVIFNSQTGSFYLLMENRMNWNEANSTIENSVLSINGKPNFGRLVTINSQEEQDFIETMLSTQLSNYWIGATRDTNGTFRWVTDEQLLFTNWISGEPNNFNGNESILAINSDGGWNDVSNENTNGMIIEFVQNKPPVVFNHINDITVSELQTDDITIELRNVFLDENADITGYSVSNTNSNIISAQVHGSKLSVSILEQTPVQSEITVTSVDTRGNSTTQSFFFNITSIQNLTILNTETGSHYLHIGNTISWDEANATAQSLTIMDGNGIELPGHLVTINSQIENDFIQTTFFERSDNLWIGAIRDNNEFAWSTHETFSYQNWLTGEPNNSGGSENVVSMNANGKWNDVPSDILREYVVEFSPSSPPFVKNEINDETLSIIDAISKTVDLGSVFADLNQDISHFTITNSNETLVTSSMDGNIVTFLNIPNQFGEASITITAHDDQNQSATDTFTITVGAIDQMLFNPDNGNFYTVSNVLLDWHTAASHSELLTFTDSAEIVYQGHLVTINSTFEQQFVESNYISAGNSIWIGASRDAQDNFNWVTNEAFTFTNWNEGEPNNSGGSEDVAIIASSGKWNDIPSNLTRNYIVEFEPVNSVPVVVAPVDDVIVSEDSVDSVIDISGVFEESSETLTLSFTNSNEALVAANLVDGVLTISYLTDQNGSAEIAVTATNSESESVTDTFIVTVNSVNDAPSFALGNTPQTIAVNAGTQVLNGVAVDLSAGPENETNQSLSLTVTNDNPGLFEVEPAIDTNGTLTYSAVAGEEGEAIVSVTLMDDGGVENGGVDTSETLTFPIKIENANAVLTLIDSNGNGIAGATAQYNADGSWLDLPGVTDADGEIIFTIDLSGRVKFRMTYEGSNKTLTQNIDDDPTVTFQTVNTTVELVDSSGAYITDENGVVEFNRNGWQFFGTTDGGFASREMLPGNYNFRMSYANGSFTISQNIGNDPVVTFETVPVTVSLVDSTDTPIRSEGDVSFRGKEWVSMGVLDTGSVTKELLPAPFRFRVTYASATVEKRSNVKFEPNITFKTKNVSIELRNSADDLITDGTARIEYNSNGWNELGITDTGTLSVELLPKTYKFRIEHKNTKKEKSQNVQFNPTIAFQTIRFDLELRNSETNFITDNSGTVQFNSSGWNSVGDTVDGSVSVELLPNLYNFRMTYANASLDQKNDYFQSTVVFQTEKMRVELLDSMDELFIDAEGNVQFHSGGWQPMGDLVNGVVTKELLPKVYSFRMNYANASNDKKNDGDDPLLVTFNTNNVLVQLIDSAGYLLEDDFNVEYNSGGWQPLGSSNTGQVSLELLPKTYQFRLEYNGKKETQKVDVIDPETIIDFFTGQVFSLSNSAVQVNSGGWKDFSQNMELLSGNYKFKYSDGSRITYTIEPGFINEIE